MPGKDVLKFEAGMKNLFLKGKSVVLKFEAGMKNLFLKGKSVIMFLFISGVLSLCL